MCIILVWNVRILVSLSVTKGILKILIHTIGCTLLKSGYYSAIFIIGWGLFYLIICQWIYVHVPVAIVFMLFILIVFWLVSYLVFVSIFNMNGWIFNY